MTIKLTMTDGTVIEGTAEEIAELQRLTGGKIGDKPKYKEEENDDKLKVYDARGNEIKEGDRVKLQAKGEPSFDLSVGDYAKVTGLTVFGDITEGSYVKIVEDIDSDGEYEIELIDGSDCDYAEPEALEKVELTDRELTFLKAGRKPGEFNIGDLAEVIDIHHTIPENFIVEIVKKYIDGYVLTKRSEEITPHLFKPEHLKLIAPVEARVDR